MLLTLTLFCFLVTCLCKRIVDIQPSPTSRGLSGAVSGVSSGGYMGAEGGVGVGGGGDGNPGLPVSVEGRIRKGVDLARDGKEGLFQVTGTVIHIGW